jgi:hypothetical protein
MTHPSPFRFSHICSSDSPRRLSHHRITMTCRPLSTRSLLFCPPGRFDRSRAPPPPPAAGWPCPPVEPSDAGFLSATLICSEPPGYPPAPSLHKNLTRTSFPLGLNPTRIAQGSGPRPDSVCKRPLLAGAAARSRNPLAHLRIHEADPGTNPLSHQPDGLARARCCTRERAPRSLSRWLHRRWQYRRRHSGCLRCSNGRPRRSPRSSPRSSAATSPPSLSKTTSRAMSSSSST